MYFIANIRVFRGRAKKKAIFFEDFTAAFLRNHRPLHNRSFHNSNIFDIKKPGCVLSRFLERNLSGVTATEHDRVNFSPLFYTVGTKNAGQPGGIRTALKF